LAVLASAAVRGAALCRCQQRCGELRCVEQLCVGVSPQQRCVEQRCVEQLSPQQRIVVVAAPVASASADCSEQLHIRGSRGSRVSTHDRFLGSQRGRTAHPQQFRLQPAPRGPLPPCAHLQPEARASVRVCVCRISPLSVRFVMPKSPLSPCRLEWALAAPKHRWRPSHPEG
jgi:hypothetical protein